MAQLTFGSQIKTVPESFGHGMHVAGIIGGNTVGQVANLSYLGHEPT